MTADNPTGNEPINMAEAASLLLNRTESEDNPEPNQEVNQPETEIEKIEVSTTDTEELTSEEPNEALEAVEENVSEELDEEIISEDEAEEYEEQEYFTVKINGEDKDVTLDELAAGYSRQSDYTKKTTEVAGQRKEIEQMQSELLQERQALQQGLQQLNQQLSSQSSNEPTKEYWDNLYQDDPLEYVKQKDDWRDKKEQLTQVTTAQQQLAQQQAQEQQVEFQKHLAQEQQKLVQAIPEWKDAKKAEVEKASMVTWAKRAGFSEQELNQASDHRAIVTMRKAYLFDQLQNEKPLVQKKVRRAPKMTKGGKPTTSNDLRKQKVDKALNKLSTVQSMDSAVDYLLTKNT
tara:strand:- start:3736 stop:4776 length:1041 start_codon:yes stop_codon:yes gene_type:complete